MSKTACDLRVLLRFNDGTIGGYAVNGIPSAARMREELACAGEAFSDHEAAEDCRPAADWDPTVVAAFDAIRSAQTVGR